MPERPASLGQFDAQGPPVGGGSDSGEVAALLEAIEQGGDGAGGQAGAGGELSGGGGVLLEQAHEGDRLGAAEVVVGPERMPVAVEGRGDGGDARDHSTDRIVDGGLGWVASFLVSVVVPSG